MPRVCESGSCHTLINTTEKIIADTCMSRESARIMLVDACKLVPIEDDFDGCPMSRQMTTEQIGIGEDLNRSLMQVASDIGVPNA